MTQPDCGTPFQAIKAQAAIVELIKLIKEPGIVRSLSACAVRAVAILVLSGFALGFLHVLPLFLFLSP